MVDLMKLAEKYDSCEMCKVHIKGAAEDDTYIGELCDKIRDLNVKLARAEKCIENQMDCVCDGDGLCPRCFTLKELGE